MMRLICNIFCRAVMDPTAVNRKRNTSTASVPHQIALDPVQEEPSINEDTEEDSDQESLGTFTIFCIILGQTYFVVSGGIFNHLRTYFSIRKQSGT